MTQLSRPYQIALVTLALLVLVWFAALHGRRPSSGGGSGSSPAASSAPASPAAAAKAAAASTHVYHGAAPGVEGLTRAIDKAHGAVAQSQQEAHRVETSEPSASSSASAPASHATTSAPAHPAAVKPAPAHPAAVKPAHVHATPPVVKHPAAKASMQATVEHELQQRKTVLILFWNRHGSDDMAVHSALPAVQHALGHKVAIHYATAGQVGAFGTVTHAVQVTQTPTLLIVNPHGQTTVLTGLNDAFAIQQAISESQHS